MSELATLQGEWFSETGLNLPPGLPFERWEALGKTLKAMEKGVQFWVGDWLNYGEREFGDRYVQAVEETGYTHGALRNMAWVSKEIPPSSRDDALTFSHYRSLARVEPEKRQEWVQEIKEKEMSVGELNGRLNAKGYKGTMVYTPQEQLNHLKELARHADLDAQRNYAQKWSDPL